MRKMTVVEEKELHVGGTGSIYRDHTATHRRHAGNSRAAAVKMQVKSTHWFPAGTSGIPL